MSRVAALLVLFFCILIQEALGDYIFGYGSLANSRSRELSLGRSSSAMVVEISKDFGYRRVWCFHSQKWKMTALGLEKSSVPDNINGVIYWVDEKDFPALDQREAGYDRIEIPRLFTKILSEEAYLIPPEEKIWVYVPKPENCYPPDENYPIKKFYLDMCVSGFSEHGIDQAVNFLNRTHGWKGAIVDDRQEKYNEFPYLFKHINYKKIDCILDKVKINNIEEING